MKTVYISGKITGSDDYMERFGEAERELRQSGYEVINPVTIPGAEEMSYEDVMKECLKRVESADYLYMLHGWAWSKGAIAELRHFLDTHNRDEFRVYYEIQGGMPNAKEMQNVSVSSS